MVRAHKNAPVEISSKKRVSVLREVVPVNKKKAIDPRFDRSFGNFNEDLFSKSYEFLGEMQKDEKRELHASLRKELNPHRKYALKRTLDSINSMHEAKVKKERRQKIIREHRKMEVKLVAEGKTPYYLKERDIKKLELAEEYENVKKRLGSAADLEKFIEKKRKRKASKQKRFIPNRDYDAE